MGHGGRGGRRGQEDHVCLSRSYRLVRSYFPFYCSPASAPSASTAASALASLQNIFRVRLSGAAASPPGAESAAADLIDVPQTNETLEERRKSQAKNQDVKIDFEFLVSDAITEVLTLMTSGELAAQPFLNFVFISSMMLSLCACTKMGFSPLAPTRHLPGWGGQEERDLRA